jgi:hypothetical protein
MLVGIAGIVAAPPRFIQIPSDMDAVSPSRPLPRVAGTRPRRDRRSGVRNPLDLGYLGPEREQPRMLMRPEQRVSYLEIRGHGRGGPGCSMTPSVLMLVLE